MIKTNNKATFDRIAKQRKPRPGDLAYPCCVTRLYTYDLDPAETVVALDTGPWFVIGILEHENVPWEDEGLIMMLTPIGLRCSNANLWRKLPEDRW